MYFITTKRMLELCFSAHPNIQYRTSFSSDCFCIVWCIENSFVNVYNYDIAFSTGGLLKWRTLKFYIHGQVIRRLFI